MEPVFEGRGFGFWLYHPTFERLAGQLVAFHRYGTPCQEVFAYATTKPVTNVLAKHI